MIQKVEILKMASKMAVSQASKTYMTDILDKNTLKFAFLWMYRGLMIQTIKLEHGFDSEGLNFKMASETAVS